MAQIEVITQQSNWENVAVRLAREPELAIDTESNSLHAYREQVCLIQIGTPRETFLIDPLAVKDLTSLGNLLANPAIIKDLHGSDYDIRCFDRDYQFRISSLFDTQIAARFLGSSTPNLASVLENFLGVSIPKSHQLQRSDWAHRPLKAVAIDYAASDVLHLVQLAESLRQRLARLGRLEWVAEECRRMEQVRFRTPDPPEVAFLQVKGSDRLGPRELAVLKELFLWRQGKAMQLGYPLYRVLTNEDLVRAAQEAAQYPMSEGQLEQRMAGYVPALREHLVGGSRDDVMSAMQRGIQGPLVYRPEIPRRFNAWTLECRDRLQRLKQRRTSLGANLQIDPALVWPAASLERVALNPGTWRVEFLDDGNQEVRGWQRQEFSQHLMELLGVRG
ncbi:MAG TPA: hypothetical protein VFR55_01030 [Dehalococcoidia bacterium]|nr:hypothetical protein [Dehalococcoidia bacterium]